MFGRKASGGKIEVLVERMLDEHRVLAHVRASKAPKEGAELLLGEDESVKATMVARHDALFEIRFDDERDVLTILNQIGHMPLPPYIDRPDEESDRELYQTVYNDRPGAVAAPTAGCTLMSRCWRHCAKRRGNGLCHPACRGGDFPAGACG